MTLEGKHYALFLTLGPGAELWARRWKVPALHLPLVYHLVEKVEFGTLISIVPLYLEELGLPVEHTGSNSKLHWA